MDAPRFLGLLLPGVPGRNPGLKQTHSLISDESPMGPNLCAGVK